MSWADSSNTKQTSDWLFNKNKERREKHFRKLIKTKLWESSSKYYFQPCVGSNVYLFCADSSRTDGIGCMLSSYYHENNSNGGGFENKLTLLSNSVSTGPTLERVHELTSVLARETLLSLNFIYDNLRCAACVMHPGLSSFNFCSATVGKDCKTRGEALIRRMLCKKDFNRGKNQDLQQ